MPRIAFLGTGAMGSRMARSLLEAGHEVTVWNRTAEHAEPLIEAGASSAQTPREAAASAVFAFSMVRDDNASRAVWLDPDHGALAGMPTGATAVECSTVTVDWAQALAAHAEKSGVGFLDAPVAGSRPQAEARQLIFLVGGNADVVTTAEPVLECMGAAVHHAGAAGAGAAVKLAVNALLGIQTAALAELLNMLKSTGLDPRHCLNIIAQTPVCSPAAKLYGEGIVNRRFEPQFPIELVEKDFGYLNETGHARGADTPVADAARQRFAEAVEAGYGEQNMTAVTRLYD